ncbi:MAG: cache domain-containing protein [Labilithrix sp.]|nr:cache domain-containing protein [Labilithrix sp.]MCW5812956.1 cache domain-containing protein [Labilithrix sp.]
MRNKIIAVNAVIVLIVGLLAFAIVKTQLSLATGSTDALKKSAQQDAVGVAAKLQLDGLRAERWLAAKSAEKATGQSLSKATQDARAGAARQLSDQIANAATAALGAKPSFAAVVDTNGKILGRNGSDLTSGDDVAANYPAFKEALAKTSPGSDIWVDAKRADQYLASYVPVRDDNGRTMMLVIGVGLNDALARSIAGTSGRGVLLVNDKGEIISSTQTTDEVKAAVKDGAGDVKNALTTGTVVGGGNGNVYFAAAPLDGLGLKQTAVVAVAPTTLLEGTGAVPYSILGAMALGLVLVVAGGWFLGNYISQPLAKLEEGLLAILNGQSDKRFDMDHAELGGLAFRIDQLLNQLMGVEEDNTDEEGRVSKAPVPAGAAQNAYGIDPSFAGVVPSSNPGVGEPADQYYARLYNEYITAKRGLGEAVDQITPDVFKNRIQSMEQEALAKHGKPVRYQVQVNGREVQLLAVAI